MLLNAEPPFQPQAHVSSSADIEVGVIILGGLRAQRHPWLHREFKAVI